MLLHFRRSPMCVQFGPTLIEIAADSGSNSTELGSTRSVEFGPKVSNFGTRAQPTPVACFGLESTELGSISTEFGPTSIKSSNACHRNWPRTDEIWHEIDELGPGFDETWLSFG